MSAIIKEERIGGQRLILGDCLEVMKDLGRFDHVISDPPYEDELHAAVGKFKTLRSDGKSYASNNLDSLGFAGVNNDRAAFSKAIVDASAGWVIVFTLAEGVRAWRDDLQGCGLKYDTCLAWVKPDSAPQFNGQGAARGFECAVPGWAGKGHRKWNGGGKRGVYTHPVNPPSRHGLHPTEKPVSLMAELLRDFTNPSQTILDPFMGSGTTLVACQRMGRAGTGIDLDTDYFQIACERVHKAWQEPDMLVQDAAPKPEQMGMFE